MATIWLKTATGAMKNHRNSHPVLWRKNPLTKKGLCPVGAISRPDQHNNIIKKNIFTRQISCSPGIVTKVKKTPSFEIKTTAGNETD